MAGLAAPRARLVALARGRSRAARRRAADAYIGPGAGFALLSSFLRARHDDRWSLSRRCWPGRFARSGARSRGRRPPQAAIGRLIVVGLRRPGSGADRSVHEGGLLPNFSALAKHGLLPPAADDVPVGVAGGVVVVQHRHAPGAAQHLRLPRSRPAHLPADAVVDAHRQGRAVPAARPLPHSAASGPSCACCASRSRSGRSSASTASGARSCACRSPFRPTASTAPS